MGIFELEVVAPTLHFIRRDTLSEFRLQPALALCAAPPVYTGFQMFNSYRLSHRIGLLVLRDAMFVKPDLLGGLALLEEQEVSTDAGIGLKYAVGKPDDGVQIAF